MSDNSQRAGAAIINGITGMLKAKQARDEAVTKMKTELQLEAMKKQLPTFMEKIMAAQYKQENPEMAGMFGGTSGAPAMSGGIPNTTPATTGGVLQTGQTAPERTATAGMKLPFGGETQKFINSPRVMMKGDKFTRDVPDNRAIYDYLTKKKQVAAQDPKIKFDKQDEEMLATLGIKLGFAKGTYRTLGMATQGQIYTAAKNLAEAENPMAGEKEIQAKIPIVRKMMEGIVPSAQSSQSNLSDLKPEGVDQSDWDNASDIEKQEFLQALGQ